MEKKTLNKSQQNFSFQVQDVLIQLHSRFDSGNLYRAEYILSKSNIPTFQIWSAKDNCETSFQAKNKNQWFYFCIQGLSKLKKKTIRIVLMHAVAKLNPISGNYEPHGIFKGDMRPVYCSSVYSNNQWERTGPLQCLKDDSSPTQVYFDFSLQRNTDTIIDGNSDDGVYFAMTYPYSYQELQNHLAMYERDIAAKQTNILLHRELLIETNDNNRVELLTITSHDENYQTESPEREPIFPHLFPESNILERPIDYIHKDIVFISARVHPGEVPSQFTMKGIMDFLLDVSDKRAVELRKRYIFKIIPMLNPDGVIRGHMRHDQYGNNLNRHYKSPSLEQQPSIFAAQTLIDYYATNNRLLMYLDLHAHSTKKGCFIYGNVLNSIDDQIQNQLFCKLIALNSPYFDYDGCLFSTEHMKRIDPGDVDSGLSAEGSGRVNTFLKNHLIHSYTLECNYNSSKIENEISILENDPCSTNPEFSLPYSSIFTTNTVKYTPLSFENVGRACLISLLDIRHHNPCSRITTSKFKSLENIRASILSEIKLRKEYRSQISTTQSNNSPDSLIFHKLTCRSITSSNNSAIKTSNSLIPRRFPTISRCYSSDSSLVSTKQIASTEWKKALTTDDKPSEASNLAPILKSLSFCERQFQLPKVKTIDFSEEVIVKTSNNTSNSGCSSSRPSKIPLPNSNRVKLNTINPLLRRRQEKNITH